jgi:hypothetical protein
MNNYVITMIVAIRARLFMIVAQMIINLGKNPRYVAKRHSDVNITNFTTVVSLFVVND